MLSLSGVLPYIVTDDINGSNHMGAVYMYSRSSGRKKISSLTSYQGVYTWKKN